MTIKFDIITYCSKNYEEAFKFFINSWVENCNSKKIYVYTDNLNIPGISDKIVFKPVFEDTDDYETNVGRKALALKDYYENYAIDHFILLDIDNYILEDVSEAFDGDFELGVTRLLDRWRGKKKTVTASNVFFNNSPNLRIFIDEWLAVQRKFYKSGKGVHILRDQITYVQLSFDRIIRKDWNGGNKFKIKPLPREVYNSEENTLELWLKTINRIKPKILHFKGERWKIEEYIAKTIDEFKRIK